MRGYHLRPETDMRLATQAAYRHQTLPYSGTDGAGVPFFDPRPTEFQSAWHFRDDTDKTHHYLEGTRWRYPKDHRFEIDRLIAHAPVHVEAFVRDTPKYYASQYFTGHMEVSPAHTPDGEFVGINNMVRANVQALNGLRNGHNLQLGADLIEGRQTLGMLAGYATPLFQALHAARRGQWGKIPSILSMKKKEVLSGKYPANKWLEYQFGWKPLLSELDDAHKLLRIGARKDADRIYKSSGKRKAQAYRHYEEDAEGWTKDRTDKYFADVTYYYRVNNYTIDTLDRCGLSTLADIVWEEIPFSFVVDWFVPVGQVLTAMTATSGLSFVAGYKVDNRLAEAKNTFTYREKDDPKSNFVHRYSGGFTEAKSLYFARNVIHGFIPPQLFYNAHPFSTAHVMNAISLIRQLI